MIFRQLFEPLSSTYTYLLGCRTTGRAVLIDPVITSIDRDLAEIRRLGLNLVYSIETHIHAYHIPAALELKKRVGSKIAAPAFDRRPCTDSGIEEGKSLCIGDASPCSRCTHPATLMDTSLICVMTGYLPATHC